VIVVKKKIMNEEFGCFFGYEELLNIAMGLGRKQMLTLIVDKGGNTRFFS